MTTKGKVHNHAVRILMRDVDFCPVDESWTGGIALSKNVISF